MNKTKIIGKD